MEDKKNFGFGTQIRKSPYFNSTVKWGATGFSVYNHMYIPLKISGANIPAVPLPHATTALIFFVILFLFIKSSL